MARRKGEGGSEEAIVLDTNTVIAGLLRNGFTRRLILLVSRTRPTYYPQVLLEEVEEHLEELASRTHVDPESLRDAVRLLLSDARRISTEEIQGYLHEATRYVRDLDDAFFVASALLLRERYPRVILLSWNLRNYDLDSLARLQIEVLTPPRYAREIARQEQ
ncbi:hypothetical protein Pyrde_0758 [Pyrodictium delaneyi]|uniref:PIN domain-containing protein n=1 Tax=Pyrodictium delaneyi TaxID=1273541 RepID=A0A0P0N1R6_9CREN|nr:PIN domain-containing protein [Pyrodictium delaneyi]ALL00808.1 hypothetical protein Pyrde_0758 [Pyrodictium delaneyi]